MSFSKHINHTFTYKTIEIIFFSVTEIKLNFTNNNQTVEKAKIYPYIIDFFLSIYISKLMGRFSRLTLDMLLSSFSKVKHFKYSYFISYLILAFKVSYTLQFIYICFSPKEVIWTKRFKKCSQTTFDFCLICCICWAMKGLADNKCSPYKH